MIKALTSIVLLLYAISCNSADKKYTFIRKDYCIENDSYNNMTIIFDRRQDTIYFSYINVIDDGNYVNAFSDTSEYAGFFTFDNIKDSSVQFTIKNYRYENDGYGLTLHYRESGKIVLWNIDSPVVAYLPKKASFRVCN